MTQIVDDGPPERRKLRVYTWFAFARDGAEDEHVLVDLPDAYDDRDAQRMNSLILLLGELVETVAALARNVRELEP